MGRRRRFLPPTPRPPLPSWRRDVSPRRPSESRHFEQPAVVCRGHHGPTRTEIEGGQQVRRRVRVVDEQRTGEHHAEGLQPGSARAARRPAVRPHRETPQWWRAVRTSPAGTPAPTLAWRPSLVRSTQNTRPSSAGASAWPRAAASVGVPLPRQADDRQPHGSARRDPPLQVAELFSSTW